MSKSSQSPIAPEHTAVRVALWRALHLVLDPDPPIFNDPIGAELVAENNWQQRPDMNAEFSKPMRASIVGRARFIEDLVEQLQHQGIRQYVILGAGLDTFAQRRLDIASTMQIFEVDQSGPQEWKKQRLQQCGYSFPDWLHFVPVNFEKQSWWNELIAAGFDIHKPALIVSTGVSMYLSKEANLEMLNQISKLSSGSVFAMTFMLALDLLEPVERGSLEYVMQRVQESGTPFLSLFKPQEIMDLATQVGFKNAEYVSGESIYQRYFAMRSDGLRAGQAEAFLIAST